MNGIASPITELRPNEKRFGSSVVSRNTFVILISVLVWTMEVFLILSLRASKPPYQLSMWFYSLPVFHLLPWAVGLQALGKIKKALSEGTVVVSGAHLAYGIVLSLLIATYVVLGSAETMGMLTYRLSALHACGSPYQ
jgi:hypothetical protein